MIKKKLCSNCRKEKQLKSFSNDSKHGKQSWCRVCQSERYRTPEYKLTNALNQARIRARKVGLPANLTNNEYRDFLNNMYLAETHCIIETGNNNPQLGHWLPLSIGHGGTVLGNLFPQDGIINSSWYNRNPYDWVKTQPKRVQNRFKVLELVLAQANGLHTNDFKAFTSWCFDNQRSIAEAEADPRSSLEIWKEAIHKQKVPC